VSYAILGAVVFSFILTQINQRRPSPIILVVDHWVRWFLFAFGGAWICHEYQLVDRPFWVLSAAFFLAFFIGDTAYNWLAVSALSASPLPLFPRYEINRTGGEWPVQPRLLRVREWLRSQGFTPVQALRIGIGGGIYLRVAVYQDGAAALRLCVMFLPQPNGSIGVSYEISSLTTDGRRYVTDNFFIPFGGFYPENWFVERRPWRRSLPRLLARHRARLAASRVAPAPFTNEPLMDINATQSELERLNTELGFLHPYHDREEFGKISPEGRYRVWKEIWMLNYLGRTSRYH
jgi:hypothetical protein